MEALYPTAKLIPDAVFSVPIPSMRLVAASWKAPEVELITPSFRRMAPPSARIASNAKIKLHACQIVRERPPLRLEASFFPDLTGA